MIKPIYLDYMATTPVDPRVASKMNECLIADDKFGNPSSEHYYGFIAREMVEKARSEVAALINADPEEIIWTSGATEANNLAIKGAALFYKRKGKHIITLTTEHKSVLDCYHFLETEGFNVTYLNPEKNGILDLNKLEAALRDDTILVSVLAVNNEIGVIQDLAAISALTRPRGIILHVDAAQGAGKIPIDVKKDFVDLMTFSAHKVYGPKGMGALYMRHKPKMHLDAQIHGGGQENYLRAGTLATHQIVGMGEAFKIAKLEMPNEVERISSLRNKLLNGLKNLPMQINGDLVMRIPHNLNVSFKGVNGEMLFLELNKNLAISAGSACMAQSLTPSHVLSAIGLSHELSGSSIRFSLGRFTTDEEIERVVVMVNDSILKSTVI
jgi:cysteine desulfurase